MSLEGIDINAIRKGLKELSAKSDELRGHL